MRDVLLKYLLAMLFLSVSAWACARGELIFQVPPSFSVSVSNELGPVVGLKMRVTHFHAEEFSKLTAAQQRTADPKQFVEQIAESVTDENGVAHFHLSHAGTFDIYPDHPAWEQWDISIEVRQDATTTNIPLTWPNTAILHTTELRGKIATGLYSSASHPLAEANVSLHDLISFKELANATTTPDGSFKFANVAAGLYFVRLKAKESGVNAPDGDIPVLIEDKASRNSLSIAVNESDCGLSYDLEENKPRYKPLACFKGGKQVPCNY